MKRQFFAFFFLGIFVGHLTCVMSSGLAEDDSGLGGNRLPLNASFGQGIEDIYSTLKPFIERGIKEKWPEQATLKERIINYGNLSD